MLEQKNQPSDDATPQNMTQLEGIHQKVFMDRYSLKDANGKPLEFYPEQLWARVARGIAAVEQTEEKREEWEKLFYEALTNFQFVPGGRILAGAGTGHQVTYYNCMPPDQEVLTADGYRPISEIKIGDLVVTHRNRLRPVLHKFERETEEMLYIIRPKKIGYDDLRLTGDHKVYIVRSEWVNTHKSRDGLHLQHEPDWIPAKEIKPDDYVAVAYNDEEYLPATINIQDYVSGYTTQDGKLFKAPSRRHLDHAPSRGTSHKIQNNLELDGDLCYLFGRWLGDGCVTHRGGTDIPSGIKIVFSLDERKEAEEIARIIETKFGIEPAINLSNTKRWYDLWVHSMPFGEFFKAFLGCYSHSKRIPEQLMHLPAEFTLELLRGLFSADGYVSDNKLGIVLANRTLAIQIHQLLLRMGYLFSIRENTHRLGRVPAYRVQATANECAPLFERFFGVQAPGHNIDLKYYFEYDNLKWIRVDEIAIEDYVGIVLDIEVEEDHSFISAGIVASNCFVIPSPEDSRQGILDNLKVMTEIMARGGGVGINLSTLRPRGSYIKTVNGTASGPCSWAQLYSVATGDVIQQGGSRRGALMIMLDDTHPDIEEFITVKRESGKIEHANLSICVSDGFMQAVKNDANWDLIWQGEVKKTVSARHLWDLICTSAWESAEPGLVFMDRCNKEANTWYYESIRCVNPCGEQPLPFWGVCNLGALNLTSFVKDGSMDWEQLAKVSKIAMRFLDNVIDATEYFISDNQEAQLGTRRTGLGTMGLADALIKMKVPYGSEGSLPIIEHIYATIRDASYEASADIATEKGPFPKFDRDKYMQGKFIKRLPKPIQEKIEKQGVRNAVLLTQAPTGTTSLLAGVSSGIEPVYDFAMIRRDRTGEHILYHPLLQAWRNEHPDAPTPIYFVSSKDLTPEEHVRVQAMVQCYTDASISKCVVGDTLVSSERGLLPIADLYAGEQPNTFRSLALHVASLERTQITSHFYFGGVRPTRRVKLADGHEITGTPNHRLYVGTAEGLMWKRLDELVPGNYVALKIGAQLFGTDVSLCGFQQSTIRSGYQKTIQVPASMNPMLAHFVGSYIAEGCIIHYTVRITNNEGGVLERLREETRLLFGLDGSITPQGRNNALTLQINSKSLCELLRFLGCEGSAAQKTIPWAVLQSSRESIVAFLSGLYLDGFITDKKVGICLASQKLIQQLQIVFDNFGVQTWISVKHNVQYDRDYYELNAHGQEAQRLLRLLTFDEAHKRERALLLRREFQGSNSDIIPVEARKSVFADAPRTVRYRHHAYSQALPQEQEGRQLTWFGLRRLANDPEVPLTPSLREIWQESLHFRRVVAVEDSGEQSVYDLSVPTTSAFVGNGIVNHNTVNAPNDHTVEQVQKLYRLAYEMGCKGVTYYRDGSRDAVLTRVEDEKKAAATQTPAIEMVTSIHQGIKQRPAVVQGYTRQVNAPEGKVNVTINSDEQGPFEVFVNVGKAGSDIAALSEALGRLISLNLQILSPLSPVDRAQEISKQLRGIGGSRSVGFGSQQVRSLPDAVARALELHIEAAQAAGDDAATHNGHTQANNNGQEISASVSQPLKVTGNLCSQCGCNTMVYEEGCKKCYSCGYSEC